MYWIMGCWTNNNREIVNMRDDNERYIMGCWTKVNRKMVSIRDDNDLSRFIYILLEIGPRAKIGI